EPHANRLEPEERKIVSLIVLPRGWEITEVSLSNAGVRFRDRTGIPDVRHAPLRLNIIRTADVFDDRQRYAWIGNDVPRVLRDLADVNDGPALVVHGVRRDGAERIPGHVERDRRQYAETFFQE